MKCVLYMCVCTCPQVSPLFGSIYNSLYYIAMAVEQTRSDTSGRWVTGEALANGKGEFEFEGFNQKVHGDAQGAGMQVSYAVLDTNGRGGRLRRTHMLMAAHTSTRFGGLKYMGQSIHFAGSTPSSESYCWFSPYMACSGGSYHFFQAAGVRSYELIYHDMC